LEPVTRIAKYEVGRKLGQGGFGEIYVARDTELDRELAIKVLRDEHTQRPPLVQRFLQEARAAARINHPGIVTVFECGQTDAGIVFIAMELLAGETLATRIKREHLALPAAIAVTRQLASALAAAHAAGIIHRDLKPQNVFLVPDPAAVGGVRVKILDFGIAKLTDTVASNVQTHSMEMMGTPMYMSPEQCKSSATVDARSDIYALGCILFELLAGRTPFEGEPGELIAKHQLVPPPQLRELVTGVPEPLEQLVAAMLAKAPADRPAMTAIIETADAVPTTGTLARTTPPPTDVGFAPTLASGGTLTDPNAARVLATVPLRPATPAGTPAPPTPAPPTPVPAETTAPPARRRRRWLIPIGVVLAVTGVKVGRNYRDVVADDDDDRKTPVTTPRPPEPPTPPKHDGDDDDDDDTHPPGPTIPKIPKIPKVPKLSLDQHDLDGLAPECRKIMQAGLDAQAHGDTGAMIEAATKVATCEAGTVGSLVDGKDGCHAELEAGKAAEARGDHAAALDKLKAAYACQPTPKTLQLAVTAACRAGDDDEVKELWPKLDPHAKSKLAAVCANSGVSVE